MLSRVADSLYWMSRYLERGEHTARMLAVQRRVGVDAAPEETEKSWRRLIACLNIAVDGDAEIDGEAVFRSLALERSNPHSIIWCISRARDNARQVREQISSEMWERLNREYLTLSARIAEHRGDTSYNFFAAALENALLFQGITDATMSHGEGWQYVQLGRFIERSQLVPALLGAHYEAPIASETIGDGLSYEIELINLLKMCGAFEAYCKVHTAKIDGGRVAEFLILDPEFPRSIRYAVDRLETVLRRFPAGGQRGSGAGRAQRLAGRLRANLEYGQLEEISARGTHDYLMDVRLRSAEIHECLYETYINYPVDAYLAS